MPTRWYIHTPSNDEPDDYSYLDLPTGQCAETAAEKAAEHYDAHEGDYPDERIVWVRPFGSTTWRKFKVSAETTRLYSSSELT